MAEKFTRKNQTKESTEICVLDSGPMESGVQSNEISNNECALCFGLYEDDLSMTRKLEREWVQCTNITCGKWMHVEYLNVTRHEKPGLCTQNTPIHIIVRTYLLYGYEF